MNLQQLEYALLIKKLGSFSKAAKRAQLTQSAISQQLTKLEQEAGFPIFERKTKPIRPTEKGQLFLEKAQLATLAFHQLEEYTRSLAEEEEGSVTIGIIPTLAPYLVSFFIHDLARRHPHIRLEVREMITKDIIRGIIDRELNGGIIATPITTTIDFSFEPLFYEQFYLYVSYKHDLFKQKQIDLGDIKAGDLWLLNEGNCFSDQVNNMCSLEQRNNQRPSLAYHSNSIDALRRIVEYKGGLTFLPELATLNVPTTQEDMIKELSGQRRAREISLICHPNEPKREQLKQICNLIKENLPSGVLKKGDKQIVSTDLSF